MEYKASLFNYWIDLVFKYPAFLGQLDEYQIQRLEEFLKSEIPKEEFLMVKVRALNPHEEIPSMELDKLKKVQKLLDQRNIIHIKDEGLSQSRSGLPSKLNPEQIEKLYKGLAGEYIDKKTSYEHFKAIFSLEKLPVGFIKIRWIKEYRGDPHKSCLRELLNLAFNQTDIKRDQFFFSDKQGKPFKLSKRKADRYTNRHRIKFENLIK